MFCFSKKPKSTEYKTNKLYDKLNCLIKNYIAEHDNIRNNLIEKPDKNKASKALHIVHKKLKLFNDMQACLKVGGMDGYEAQTATEKYACLEELHDFLNKKLTLQQAAENKEYNPYYYYSSSHFYRNPGIDVLLGIASLLPALIPAGIRIKHSHKKYGDWHFWRPGSLKIENGSIKRLEKFFKEEEQLEKKMTPK